MQAKERRARHFKSSVGLMLNENYGDGMLPNTVQNQDFLYMPANDIPVSGPALEFLRERLGDPPSHVHKPRSIGTSDSLYQAYRRAFCQPSGMVHFDRDPCYWQSKDRPGSALGSGKSLTSSKLRNYDGYAFNGYEKGPVPDVEPASTVKSVSTAKSSATRPSSDLTTCRTSSQNGEAKHGNSEYGFSKSKVPSGKLEDNRHRLWTPGSEAAGFKAYSPFSDSLQDFGKKEAKFIAPEIKPDFDRTCDVIPAPVYKDALNKVLETAGDDNTHAHNHDGKKSRADVLKLHGNPEYPANVMADKDVPNYVAWAKIYPYCPLTQVEGKDKPVVVPPRGFTPSTPSQAGSIPKLRDMKKEKRKILDGIKLLSASSKTRRNGGSPRKHSDDTGNPHVNNNNNNNNGEIHPSLKGLPPTLAAKLNPALKKDAKGHPKKITAAFVRFKDTTPSSVSGNNNNNDNNVESNADHAKPYLPYDPHATRRLLDMKMKAPAGWYGGQTPTHTPTVDDSLPIEATRTWAKHYSPARIRQFMRAIGGDAATPEPQQF